MNIQNLKLQAILESPNEYGLDRRERAYSVVKELYENGISDVSKFKNEEKTLMLRYEDLKDLVRVDPNIINNSYFRNVVGKKPEDLKRYTFLKKMLREQGIAIKETNVSPKKCLNGVRLILTDKEAVDEIEQGKTVN